MKATEQPIDTSTAAGKCFLDMLGVFAEFETNLRRERQMKSIAKAKANGIYAGKGRPASIDMARCAKSKRRASVHGHRQGARDRPGERVSGAVTPALDGKSIDQQIEPQP